MQVGDTMSDAQVNVEAGNVQLTEAAEKSKSSNKCLLIGLAIAIVCIVLLIWLGF